MNRHLRAALALVLAASAVALSGCVVIVSQTVQQFDTIGDVQITTRICLSDNNMNSTCPRSSTNSDTDSAYSGADAQLLMGYRIADGVASPSTITASYVSPQSGSVTLAANSSYAAELQRLVPAPAGQHWAGYMSPPVATADQHQEARADVVARFGLARGADGAPFPSPFAYRTVAGARGSNDSGDPGTEPDRPVDCGSTPYDTNTTTDLGAVCIDSPKTPPADINTNDTFASADLGVLNGGTTTTDPGTPVSVPFTVRAVGLSGGTVFNLSAGTTVPGGTAQASQGAISPSSGDTTVPVSVNVPPNATPGTYAVTLTAQLGTTQVRSGMATVVVKAPGSGDGGGVGGGADTTPPLISASISKRRLGKALKKGLRVKVGGDEACAIVVKLVKSGTLGSGSGSIAGAGTTTVTAKFKKRKAKALARRKSLKLTVEVTATDPSGNAGRVRKVVKLKR